MKIDMNDLQKKILEIFMEVKRICEKNNLRYWAVSGTCLGAVRHKGFIPWDDDLDIAMPDKDYLRFLEIAPKELTYPYQLITECEAKHSTCLFAKVHNIETTMIEAAEINYTDCYKGVFIDIFPFNGLPKNKLLRTTYIWKLIAIETMNIKQRWPISAAKTLKGKLLYLVLKPINTLLPYGYWVNVWKRNAFKYSFDKFRYSTFANDREAFKLVFPHECLNSFIEIPFESTTIKIPQGWDDMLKKLYGDYMKLPPENERQPRHSGGIVDLERPYKSYLTKIKNNTD